MPDLSPSLRILRDLIAIPSVNPMGRDDLRAEIVGEQAIAEDLAERLRRLGLDAALLGADGRTSVVAEAVAPAVQLVVGNAVGGGVQQPGVQGAHGQVAGLGGQDRAAATLAHGQAREGLPGWAMEQGSRGIGICLQDRVLQGLKRSGRRWSGRWSS